MKASLTKLSSEKNANRKTAFNDKPETEGQSQSIQLQPYLIPFLLIQTEGSSRYLGVHDTERSTLVKPFEKVCVKRRVVLQRRQNFWHSQKHILSSFRALRIWANLKKNDRVGDGNRLLHLPHPLLLQVVCYVPQRGGGKLQHDQQQQQRQQQQQH